MQRTLQQLLSLKEVPFSEVLLVQSGWVRGFVIGSILILLALLPTGESLAAELSFQATGCGFSAVRDAVQDAIDSGATSVVNIPAGTCDWASNMLTLPGGISLKGAGKTATVIRSSSGAYDWLVIIDCANGKTARVSDMTLMGKGNSAYWDGGLFLRGGCRDFMVFNSKFRDFVGQGIFVQGNSRGVIYQSEFLNNYRAGQTGGTTGYGVVVYGDGTWPPLELGTANAVFVENNSFSGNRHHIASNYGSRYVFRYNTVNREDALRNYAMIDAHGVGSSPVGSRSWEVYHNTITTKLTPGLLARTVAGIEGGDGVIFNNTVTNPSTVAAMTELWPPQEAPKYPAKGQVRSGYFWNNSPNTLRNDAPSNYVLGRDYFLNARPGYTPYTYPHPLRSSQAGTPPSAPSNLRVQ